MVRERIRPAATQALVLAGGAGTRIGGVGQYLPKGLLPVSQNETLLLRLLQQLREAGICNVAISTSPHHQPLLEAFIQNATRVWRDLKLNADLTVAVYSNEAHRWGPNPALSEAIGFFRRGQPVLLCLADIGFISNPFCRLFESERHEMTLLMGPYRETQGGVAHLEGLDVRALYYRWEEAESLDRLDLCNWTGAALISTTVLEEFVSICRRAKKAPLEEPLNALIRSGVIVRHSGVDEFVNVNTFADLLTFQRRLATVGQALETRNTRCAK
ncbi:NDP-sugar pyrophosphorylase family protein [Bradyrhizobium japonicum]